MPLERPSLPELIQQSKNNLLAQVGQLPQPLDPIALEVLLKMMTAHAGSIHGLYGYLEYVLEQAFPMTARGQNLGRWADLWGVNRLVATFATGKLRVSGTPGTYIPPSTVWQSGSSSYTSDDSAVIDESGFAQISVTAQDPGSAANAGAGALVSLTSPIEGVEPNGFTETFAGGYLGLKGTPGLAIGPGSVWKNGIYTYSNPLPIVLDENGKGNLLVRAQQSGSAANFFVASETEGGRKARLYINVSGVEPGEVIPKGTRWRYGTDLFFTCFEEMSITAASINAGIGQDVNIKGTAEVIIEAEKIGKEGNLSQGKQLSLVSFPDAEANFTASLEIKITGTDGLNVPQGTQWKSGEQVYQSEAHALLVDGKARLKIKAQQRGYADAMPDSLALSDTTPVAGLDNAANVVGKKYDAQPAAFRPRLLIEVEGSQAFSPIPEGTAWRYGPYRYLNHDAKKLDGDKRAQLIVVAQTANIFASLANNTVIRLEKDPETDSTLSYLETSAIVKSTPTLEEDGKDPSQSTEVELVFRTPKIEPKAIIAESFAQFYIFLKAVDKDLAQGITIPAGTQWRYQFNENLSFTSEETVALNAEGNALGLVTAQFSGTASNLPIGTQLVINKSINNVQDKATIVDQIYLELKGQKETEILAGTQWQSSDAITLTSIEDKLIGNDGFAHVLAAVEIEATEHTLAAGTSLNVISATTGEVNISEFYLKLTGQPGTQVPKGTIWYQLDAQSKPITIRTYTSKKATALLNDGTAEVLLGVDGEALKAPLTLASPFKVKTPIDGLEAIGQVLRNVFPPASIPGLNSTKVVHANQVYAHLTGQAGTEIPAQSIWNEVDTDESIVTERSYKNGDTVLIAPDGTAQVLLTVTDDNPIQPLRAAAKLRIASSIEGLEDEARVTKNRGQRVLASNGIDGGKADGSTFAKGTIAVTGEPGAFIGEGSRWEYAQVKPALYYKSIEPITLDASGAGNIKVRAEATGSNSNLTPGIELELFDRLPVLEKKSSAIDVSVELEIIMIGGTEGTKIPKGTIWKSGLRKYATTQEEELDLSGGGSFKLMAQQTGRSSNLAIGAEVLLDKPLELPGVPPVATVLSSTTQFELAPATNGIQGGSDDETDTAFRSRLLDDIRSPVEYGTEGDYKTWALASDPAVTRAKVLPHVDGLGSVTVLVMGSDVNSELSNVTLDRVKDYLNEKRPIATKVEVGRIAVQKINLEIGNLIPNTPEVQEAVKDALRFYIDRLPESTEVLYVSNLIATIANVSVEVSHTLLAPKDNIHLLPTQVPVLGTVTFYE